MIKIAVLADLHFGARNILAPKRHCELGRVLFQRVIRRLNEVIRPDMTLIVGDMLDKGRSRGAADRMRQLADILKQLDSPFIIIPGNHDCDPSGFFDVFPEPTDMAMAGNIGFLAFIDKEEPGYNASRPEHSLERFAAARSNFGGRLTAIQHVPLLPPDVSDCPYNYVNAPEIIAAMKQAGVSLCVSGHYHAGIERLEHDGIVYICAPALSEKPFPFLVVETNGSDVSVERHQLALPESSGFSDMHIHTPFAYCNEDMDISETAMLGPAFNLADIGFAEHSSHLYFARGEHTGEKAMFFSGDAPKPDSRFKSYMRRTVRQRKRGARVGLEVDCDFKGRPVLERGHAGLMDFLIGAVHRMKIIDDGEKDPSRIADEFLAIHRKFLSNGFAALAHPFRIFRRAGLETNPKLFEPLVKMLKETNTAAELNFHSNAPSHDFFSMCIESGVKLMLGSDAHNLSEIGDFARHLRFLKEIGYDSGLNDIILPYTKERNRQTS